MRKSLPAILATLSLPIATLASPPNISMGPTALLYTPDDLNNQILDYSYAGYMAGGVALPTLPIKATLSPTGSDDTSSIQSAINTVSTLPLDSHNFRGAIYLNPGNYTLSGNLTISASGVVLRGANMNATTLTFTGAPRTTIAIKGAGASTGTGSTFSITDTYAPVGAKTITLNSTTGLAVGNLLQIRRPWTQPWIDAMAMTAFWSPKTPPPFERTITAINGTTITLDTPTPTPIESQYLTGTAQKATDSGRIQQSGIENLHIVANFTTPTISDNAVQWTNCKNCWGRNLIADGFGNGLNVDSGSKFVTVQDSYYQNGFNNGSARPSGFNINGQFVLFQRCTGVSGFAHIITTQDSTPGPNVFLNITAQGSNNFDGGPHQRWAYSLLMDNVGGQISTLKIYNAGSEGTGHGWVAGHSLCYNCTPISITVQQPAPDPNNNNFIMGYNYIFGGTGTVNNVTTPGTYINTGTILSPKSLYLEQLRERLGSAALQNIGALRFQGNFKLLNANSGLAAGTSGASTAESAPIIQTPFSAIPANEWQFIDIGSGYFEIKNLASNKALAAQSPTPNAPIIQSTYSNTASKQWSVKDLTGTTCQIINRATGLSLEVPNNSTTSGTQLDQATYTTAPSQQFQILPLQ